MSEQNKYEVLKAISHRGDRINIGSVISMTDEEALNAGEEYVKLVPAQVADDEVQASGEEVEIIPEEPAKGPEDEEVKELEQSETDTDTTTEPTGEGSGEDETVETVKHIVTQEDIENNPELSEQGIAVGDEIEIPAEVKEDLE